ncbi:hypothetical protein [Streptomyces sp. ME19-01-6]|uniref:hypothetical protein n=1 Tax=Streptomyces sp. ME19-01-6 TaxID=3028686 RepID=UPI0029BAA12D|nr:hypothetical protein [Streptomyces sp. ME19-01-6]MDX3230853.1 hypothetical protein [Streptomyces sp. ME19-01-6]
MTDGADGEAWGDIEVNRWGFLLNTLSAVAICGVVAVLVGLVMLLFGDSAGTALLVIAVGVGAACGSSPSHGIWASTCGPARV